jgi:hypothetical protein
MADAVTNTELLDGRRKVILHMTNISDGTGESAVSKLDISASEAMDQATGKVSTYMSVAEVEYDIFGFDSVRILADATTDQVLVLLPAGSGYKDFRHTGGVFPANTGAAGFTGDILLTTGGTPASGDTYDITLTLIKHHA